MLWKPFHCSSGWMKVKLHPSLRSSAASNKFPSSRVLDSALSTCPSSLSILPASAKENHFSHFLFIFSFCQSDQDASWSMSVHHTSALSTEGEKWCVCVTVLIPAADLQLTHSHQCVPRIQQVSWLKLSLTDKSISVVFSCVCFMVWIWPSLSRTEAGSSLQGLLSAATGETEWHSDSFCQVWSLSLSGATGPRYMCVFACVYSRDRSWAMLVIRDCISPREQTLM